MQELIQIVGQQQEVIKNQFEHIKDLRKEVEIMKGWLIQLRENQILLSDDLDGIKAEIKK